MLHSAFLLAPGADSVDDQGMILDPKVMFRRNGGLPILDEHIDELNDLAAFDAHQVIVMITAIEFEDRLASFEMAAAHQPRALELGQDAIDGRQSDILVMTQEFLIDILGTQMPLSTIFKNPQDLHPRCRDLEPGLFDLLVFQFFNPRRALKRPRLSTPTFIVMRPL